MVGVFGKGRSVEFVMTDNDHKLFLDKIKDKNIFFIKGDGFFKNKDVKLLENIPSRDWPTNNKNQQFLIYNKNLGKLHFDKREQNFFYMLIMGKSPVIQFLRSYRSGNVVASGRISALISHKEYVADKLIETDQSQRFIEWWNYVSRTLKKMTVKCYGIDPLSGEKMKMFERMGPDAVRLYKTGKVEFQQLTTSKKYPQISIHPQLDKK